MIFKEVRDYATANGTHYYRLLKDATNIISSTEYKALDEAKKAQYCYSHYIPNNPKEFVIVITDPINLLNPEKSPDSNTLHLTMGKFSAEYCRKIITKHYKYIVINVQQQGAESEKEQFTYNGQSIESKLEPSLQGLANNKETQRDAQVVLGLFAPDRYEIRNHLGYDITKLGNYYRSLKILKSRFCTPGLKLPLFFDGATNSFKELSDPKGEKIKEIYDWCIKKRKKV